jgi:ribonucleoside-diphosphate reductase alpha chain
MDRKLTNPGANPLKEVEYVLRDSQITNSDGSVVFELKGAQVPEGWSQLATDIAVSKYFRKAGIDGDKNKGERSVRQLVYRIAHSIREAGDKFGGYFASEADADTFEAELSHLLIHQKAAFNSPVWFNCGLYQRYGIEGSGGNYAWDPEQDVIFETSTAYEHPQCSACFIQAVNDDLMAIYELIKNEARLFKYGSGTGTNFSKIRGKQEKLSGGGTTRRAAKMVCLDMDHPEIIDFIEWKVREEKKAQALIRAGYESDFNGDAYHTVSGQNSNNSLRVTDEFMKAVETDGEWKTTLRTTGEVCDTYRARDVWRKIGEAAWACADPGVQYDTTINDWHTCPNTDRINASNPCSEYMFLDNSACNLASINLSKFLDEEGRFDIEGYRQAIRVLITAMDIAVDYASYPTRPIAKNSHNYRPLGLGYANLGTLLMQLGIPYDSDEGRTICAALTSILCGHAYATSSEIAASKGPFTGFQRNRQPMLRVMGKHRDAAYRINEAGGPGMTEDEPTGCPPELIQAAHEDWDLACKLGEMYGYRNSQTTVLAPTGTIGLLMDCDTTGIEPDFALVKFKKLAGGGYFKIVNQSVPKALQRLGYTEAQITDIVSYVTGTNTFTGAPHCGRKALLENGLTEREIEKAEEALRGVFDVGFALAPWVIGTEAYERLGIDADTYNKPGFHLLRFWGHSDKEIGEINDVVIGRMTVEGAPHLRAEHLPVFDCANRCGKIGERFLEPMAHVHMMAAAQPFLSGAISKTVNLPQESTVEDVEEIYKEGWKLGLKAIALYRDGSKSSQPLNTKHDSKDSKSEDEEEVTTEAKAPAVPAATVEAPVQEWLTPPTTRRHRLPKKRKGFTQEARIGGHKVFLRTGEYEDGSLGEIFVDMHKEGAAFRSLMNCFAISVSMGLQHGVPLDAYVLGVEYLRQYDFAQVPPKEEQEELQNPTDVAAVHRLEGTQSSEPPPAIEPAEQVTFGFDEGGHQPNALDQQLGEMMGDAPMCDKCGHITVRNGACYKCLNCGNSMGCS